MSAQQISRSQVAPKREGRGSAPHVPSAGGGVDTSAVPAGGEQSGVGGVKIEQIRKALSERQYQILLESRRLGHVLIFGSEKIAASVLQRKGLGRVERFGQLDRFFINELGRSVVAR